MLSSDHSEWELQSSECLRPQTREILIPTTKSKTKAIKNLNRKDAYAKGHRRRKISDHENDLDDEDMAPSVRCLMVSNFPRKYQVRDLKPGNGKGQLTGRLTHSWMGSSHVRGTGQVRV